MRLAFLAVDRRHGLGPTSRRVWGCIATFVIYTAVVQLFPVVSAPPENVALLWLPNAVVAVALLRTERRWWVAVWAVGLLGEVVGDGLQGIAVGDAIWFGLVNMVEATAVALVVLRFGGPTLMRSVRSLVAFLLAAMMVPAVTGMAGALGSVMAFGSKWIDAWPAWWFGDAIGLVVGVPIGVAILDRHEGVVVARSRAVVLWATAGGLGGAAIAVTLSAHGRIEPSQHVAIAVAVTLALGAGRLGAAAGTALLAVVSIVPVAREVGTLSVLESQGFLLVVVGAVLVVGAIIESEHLTRTAMGRTEARLRTTFEDAPIGMAITDLTSGPSGRWLEVNAALCRTLGLSAEALRQIEPRSLVHPDDRDFGEVAEIIAGAPGHVDAERRYRHAEGHYIWCRVIDSVVRDPSSGAAAYGVTQLVDVTAMKAEAADLAHAALHDHLTGLPNRTLLMDRLTYCVGRLRRTQGAVAVLYVDVDHFKSVNDSLGHAAGDAVLVEVGRRLRSAVRPGDTVARLGGDEFAIVCGDVVADADVTAVADRVTALLNHPMTISGQRVELSGSVGVAATRDAAHDPTELLQAADAAMYQAKANGRSRVEFSNGEPRRARAVTPAGVLGAAVDRYPA